MCWSNPHPKWASITFIIRIWTGRELRCVLSSFFYYYYYFPFLMKFIFGRQKTTCLCAFRTLLYILNAFPLVNASLGNGRRLFYCYCHSLSFYLSCTLFIPAHSLCIVCCSFNSLNFTAVWMISARIHGIIIYTQIDINICSFALAFIIYLIHVLNILHRFDLIYVNAKWYIENY